MNKERTRPSIPKETARRVLTEAGHRCAVCGEPCPLEQAHIIPWCKTQDHSEDNLVCLCASCHQRADLEDWGDKTLRYYKERPWILRRADERNNVSKTSTVKITIDMDIEDFDALKQRLLVHALASFLELSPSAIVIEGVEEGSVKLRVRLPEHAAQRLLTALEEHDPVLSAVLEVWRISSLEVDQGRAEAEEALTQAARSAPEITKSIQIAFREVILSLLLRRYDVIMDASVTFPESEQVLIEELEAMIRPDTILSMTKQASSNVWRFPSVAGKATTVSFKECVAFAEFFAVHCGSALLDLPMVERYHLAQHYGWQDVLSLIDTVPGEALSSAQKIQVLRHAEMHFLEAATRRVMLGLEEDSSLEREQLISSLKLLQGRVLLKTLALVGDIQSEGNGPS